MKKVSRKIRAILKIIYYNILYVIRVPLYLMRGNVINKTNRISSKASLIKCRLGNYNYIAEQTIMFNLTIGSYCSIGPSCHFGGAEHPYCWTSTSPLLYKNNIKALETVIGNDVWIGAQCCIKAGVTIGQGAVVGAQSYVDRDVPPYAIVFGTPARLYKFRFEKSEIDAIMNSSYWDYPPKKAKQIISKLHDSL